MGGYFFQMIRLEGVTKQYGTHVVVDHLDLDVGEGELCVLVGPSGCGKTTTMKMINRLIEPTSGRIFLQDEDVTKGDPVRLRRRMGYVIQQVGLFPHQTVADNVATVPRLLGWDKARTRARVVELLELVGLDPAAYAERWPHELSGGQRQRVGVARALGADPPVLLMDEPFGAIDPITRSRLQQEFLRLQAEVRKTVVFVTHDIEEAVLLGDRIAIFRDGGVLEQVASPADILGHPASEFVADFVGADRGLKRLSVTTLRREDLEDAPALILMQDGRATGWEDGGAVRPLPAIVRLGVSLRDALATLLAGDSPWIVVEGDDGRYAGVLTSDGVHDALRRSVDAG